jgi:hypothetical protein
MSRYFFEIVNGHRLEDPSGIDLPTDEEAMGLGKKIAVQIAVEVPTAVAKRHIAVIDDEGREVAKIKVANDD